MDPDYRFIEACKFGNLNLAQGLYKTHQIDIHADDEYAFRWSCENGHIEIAKWLLTLDKFDNALINRYIRFKDKSIYRYLFRNSYRPLNDFMRTKYQEYLKDNNNYLKTKIRTIGRFINLFNKACERLYQPLAPGYKLAESSFQSLAKIER